MEFLHDGRPPVIRKATYTPVPAKPIDDSQITNVDFGQTLTKILGSLNVASKEWVIRQYDHEVQGGSVIKPLVGIANDGPSDAAVVRPRLNSYRGLAISCGMNPHYGDFDTYHMAASAIDEAMRNCIAVGADPNRIAILDNFCWGYTDRPETLGSLVRASLACHDIAVAWKTPFISGKDSLNNEFSYQDAAGEKQTISIPSTLLISALGQVEDVRKCVTMDLKSAGNRLFVVGTTHKELGGSHFCLVNGLSGGDVPQVRADLALAAFQAMHTAIQRGLVRSCHDLSEGGLAVAVAEMAFAGGLGAVVNIDGVPVAGDCGDAEKLFAESNTRFLCEVTEDSVAEFQACLGDIPHADIGHVGTTTSLVIRNGENGIFDEPIGALKEAWQAPLRWS